MYLPARNHSLPGCLAAFIGLPRGNCRQKREKRTRSFCQKYIQLISFTLLLLPVRLGIVSNLYSANIHYQYKTMLFSHLIQKWHLLPTIKICTNEYFISALNQITACYIKGSCRHKSTNINQVYSVLIYFLACCSSLFWFSSLKHCIYHLSFLQHCTLLHLLSSRNWVSLRLLTQ